MATDDLNVKSAEAMGWVRFRNYAIMPHSAPARCERTYFDPLHSITDAMVLVNYATKDGWLWALWQDSNAPNDWNAEMSQGPARADGEAKELCEAITRAFCAALAP